MDFFAVINEWDVNFLLYLQSLQSPWMDNVMRFLSSKVVWIPLYAVLIYFLWKKFNRRVWLPIVLLIAGIIISDLVASSIFKPLVQRLRPCHEPSLEGLVRVLDGHCGGQYGFFSSHASTTFCIAVFFSLVFFRTHKVFLLLLPWSIFICISRVYLGVHYPSDVCAGIGCGGLIGFGIYFLVNNFLKKFYGVR